MKRVLEDEEEVDFIHEAVVSWLVATLGNWFVPRRGFVFSSGAQYKLTESLGRRPDVTVYFAGRRPPPRRGPAQEPPDVAVEVLAQSPGDRRRDRVVKTAEYAQFGIRYYWLIDPEARTLELLELGPDGRYVLALTAADGVVSSVPGYPELSLDLDSLWAEADRLAEDEP